MMLLGSIWAKIVAAGALVLAIAGMCLRLISIGRSQERGKQTINILNIKEKQDEAAANAPRGRSAVADRLRDGSF